MYEEVHRRNTHTVAPLTYVCATHTLRKFETLHDFVITYLVVGTFATVFDQNYFELQLF